MTRTLDAFFDGKTFLPEEPLDLQPNTRVRITIEIDSAPQAEPYSFLDLAQTLRLEGPPDWSEKIEDYLQDS